MSLELNGRRVLVVEDDYLIGSDLAYALEELGVDALGPVASVAAALALIGEDAALDAAVLDVNLGDSESYPIADRLTECGIPFIFTSGYDNRLTPTRFLDVPRFEKPADISALADGLVRAMAQPHAK